MIMQTWNVLIIIIINLNQLTFREHIILMKTLLVIPFILALSIYLDDHAQSSVNIAISLSIRPTYVSIFA